MPERTAEAGHAVAGGHAVTGGHRAPGATSPGAAPLPAATGAPHPVNDLPANRRDAVWCSRLCKAYGARAALRSVSLRIGPGEVVGLLGPNGAGKTTLVKTLMGLVRADSGEALVLGRPVNRAEARRDVGYLPELFRYQPWLSADEVLSLHTKLARVPRAERATEAREALALVGLADRGADRVASFSKGMQQRLGLAVALLGQPRLLLLDEPTSALDPGGRADVRALVESCRELGTTVVLNSHLLSEVERSCDRVIVLHRGRTLADGPLGAWLDRDEVRVRLDHEAAPFTGCVASLGPASTRGRELTMTAMALSQVPELVSRLVAAGARIMAVEPGHASLEERLLELLAVGEEEP